MDIEKLARKLRPLMPKEVDRWLSIRDLSDDDFRGLIDKQIVRAAQRHLGDYRNKLLLSLPPKATANRAIQLGTLMYEQEKWSVGISKDELLQNMSIFGRSGAGKTNAAFHILKQLAERKIPFLFLDWKRTGRHLLPEMKQKVHVYTPGRSLSEFPFNPLIVPPGLENGTYINQLVDVMADAYTLGDGARSMLQKAITMSYANSEEAPTINDLLEIVQQMPAIERQRGWKISAVRALESIAMAKITSTNRISQQELINTLCHQNTIIELDGLSPSSKKFLIPILCLWLYSVKLASSVREKLSFVILVEEAHHVLHRHERSHRESIIEMLLRQCREIGIAMIIVDQHPHLISPAALGNSYTSLCLNQKDPRDINKAASLSLMDDTDKNHLSRLPVGYAIVKLQDRWTTPFLIRMPHVKLKKGSITDQDISQAMKAISGDSGKKDARGGLNERSNVGSNSEKTFRGRIRVVDDGCLSVEALCFIEDVLTFPDDGVLKRYRRLHFSGEKGNKLKEELLERGWLESEVVPIGNTRSLLLRLTTKAQELLGNANQSSNRRESLAHAYWKRFYAERLKQAGWRVTLEADRVSGRVDVLAVNIIDGKRIGIEIETGKSDVVANVRNCLRSHFDKVIIIATTELAMKRTESALARAGLLLPNRIKLCQQERWKPPKKGDLSELSLTS